MYTAAFLYEPGNYDAEFHRLNEQIRTIASSMPGYLGMESWRSEDGALKNATYYWASLEELRAFSVHPLHMEAKSKASRWYSAYQVVIAEVVRSYGNGALPHFTPNDRAR